MVSSKLDCIKVELPGGIEEEISDQTKVDLWIQQLDQLVEDAKILVGKAIEVSQLILTSDVEVKLDENVGAISASLANALNLLSLSLSTVQSIQVNEDIKQQTDVKYCSKSESDVEEDCINDFNDDSKLLESVIGDGLSSDYETSEKVEANSKSQQENTQRKTRLRSKKEQKLEKAKIIEGVKEEKLTNSDIKELKCKKCDYATNNETYYTDHITCSLKYKKCPWCSVHAPIDSYRGELHINKHIKEVHVGQNGLDHIYQCMVCKEDLKNMKNLLFHLLRTHNINISYHCQHCEYSTVLSRYMNNHAEVHIDKATIPCSECHFKAKSKVKLRHHADYYHTSINCPTCNLECSNKSDLGRHQRLDHGLKKDDTTVCCDICGQVMKLNSLRHHRERQHGDTTFSCKQCKFKTKGRTRLKSHMRRWHKSDQPYPCDACDQAFSSRADFNTHMESVHGGQKHRCDQCDFNTAFKYNLENHIKSKHSREQHFSCNTCDAKFSLKGSLNRHVLMKHEGDIKREKCSEPGCEYTYVQTSNYRAHIKKVHEGVRYSCDVCEFVGTYRYDLTRHQRVVHQGFILRCEECSFTATKQTKLNVHILKEHRGVTWPCSECHFVGDVKGKLNIHVRAVHKGICHTCDLCKYKSPSGTNLKRHKKLVHKVEN